MGLTDGWINEDAVRLTFLQAGRVECATDGWVHCKTVPHAIVAQVVQGGYEVETPEAHIMAGPGEAFLAPAHTPLRITHHGGAPGVFMRARFVHFHFTLFDAMDVLALYRVPLLGSGPETLELGECIEGLLTGRCAAAGEDDPWWLARQRELAYRLLALVCRISVLREEGRGMLRAGSRLAGVFRHIRDHLGEPLGVGDLARAGGLSVSRFHDVFRAAVGLAPMEYVKRIRLAEGARRLTPGDRSLKEVAEACGFRNPFHFSREFKARYGVPPSDYRRRARQELGVAGGLA